MQKPGNKKQERPKRRFMDVVKRTWLRLKRRRPGAQMSSPEVQMKVSTES